VPPSAAANVLNRSHSITADVEIPEGGAEGVLVSAGGVDGGYTFYVQDGSLRYGYNYVGREIYRLASSDGLTPGRHEVRYEFEATGEPDVAQGKGAPGRGQLYIDGELVGELEMPVTVPNSFGLAGGISCGEDPGAPVIPDYEPPYAFTGKLHSVTVDVSGEVIRDPEVELRVAMARQ
jgi:arylsulfatase